MRAKVAISSTRGHEDMSHREKAEQTPHSAPGHRIVIKTHLPYDLNEDRCAVCLLACNPPGIYAAF